MAAEILAYDSSVGKDRRKAAPGLAVRESAAVTGGAKCKLSIRQTGRGTAARNGRI